MTLPARMVRRSRLLELLGAGENAVLTQVIAPPGFGKTVLLAQWLEESSARPAAWLRLESVDDEPLRFWAAVVDALQRMDAHLGMTARRLLRRAADLDLDDVVTALVADLARLPERGVLVLDDYHVITRPAVASSLSSFIDRLPPTLRLVIASRADPQLRLHRLRAAGRLAEIRQADLRFDVDESGHLLELIEGLRLDAGDVGLLCERTEGWAVGLLLAALSLRRRPDPKGFVQRFAGNDQMVADYLVAEVLDRQPPRVRRFLLATSILDAMTAPLCDELLGERESAAMLRALEAANLFVVPVDPERRWYRYHRMFRDMLLQQLRIDARQWEVTLHRAAAAWYSDNGDPSRSVLHHLSAGEAEAAFGVVDQHIETCADAPCQLVSEASLSAFPDEYIAADPNRMITYALVLLSDGQADMAITWLRRAEDQLDGAGLDPHVVRRLHRAWLLLNELHGDAQRTITEATELQTIAEASGDDGTAVRGLASRMRAHAWLYQFDAARDAYRSALAHISGRPSELRRMVLPGVLAYVAAMEGSLGEAEALVAEVVGTDPDAGWSAEVMMDPWLARAMVLRERNQLEQADTVLQHVLDLAERTRHIPFVIQGQAELASLRFAQGRGGEALDILAQARRTRPSAPLPDYLMGRVRAQEGRVWVQAGDIDRARQMLELIRHPLPAARLGARIDLAERQPRRAAERLAGVDPERMVRSAAIEYHILAARAATHHDLHEAERQMREALDLGRPEGFVRTFLDEGEEVVRLLRRLSASDPSAYLHELVAAGEDLIVPAPATPPDLFEPLSNRERAVLRLLPSQLSNQEIAGELYVSLNTVKTHLKSIYRKLDATSRSQAIGRARALRVL